MKVMPSDVVTGLMRPENGSTRPMASAAALSGMPITWPTAMAASTSGTRWRAHRRVCTRLVSPPQLTSSDESVRPLAGDTRSRHVGGVDAAEGHHATSTATPHAEHSRVVGIQDGNAVCGQRGNQLSFVRRGRVQVPKDAVVVGADVGDHADLSDGADRAVLRAGSRSRSGRPVPGSSTRRPAGYERRFARDATACCRCRPLVCPASATQARQRPAPSWSSCHSSP